MSWFSMTPLHPAFPPATPDREGPLPAVSSGSWAGSAVEVCVAPGQKWPCLGRNGKLPRGPACPAAPLIHPIYPLVVRGAWSCWTSWSPCSASCGGGHYQRTRSCTSPPPSPGEDICLGLHTEEALCATQACPGTEYTWPGLGSTMEPPSPHQRVLGQLTSSQPTTHRRLVTVVRVEHVH